MKLQYLSILLLLFFVTISSCKNDDDGPILLPQEEQNRVDDLAIVKFLQDHYFNSVGKVTKFRDDINTDDNETPLHDIAEMNSSGYWIVQRPDFQASGRKVTNAENDSILIQYELNGFIGKIKNDSVFYSTPYNISTTINTTGYPIWDPAFYYKKIASTSTALKKSYEIEGIQEGLKHFHSTNKEMDGMPAVDFQGLIIVPSRLVFDREYNVFSLAHDTSVYLNFELYQVIDRSQTP